MKVSVKFGIRCLFFHPWETKKDTQPNNSGWQPVDWDWLTGKHNFVNT